MNITSSLPWVRRHINQAAVGQDGSRQGMILCGPLRQLGGESIVYNTAASCVIFCSFLENNTKTNIITFNSTWSEHTEENAMKLYSRVPVLYVLFYFLVYFVYLHKKKPNTLIEYKKTCLSKLNSIGIFKNLIFLFGHWLSVCNDLFKKKQNEIRPHSLSTVKLN